VRAEARRTGRAVTLKAHPRRSGRAFYRRLGIVPESRAGKHVGLRWRAGSVSQSLLCC